MLEDAVGEVLTPNLGESSQHVKLKIRLGVSGRNNSTASSPMQCTCVQVPLSTSRVEARDIFGENTPSGLAWTL